MEEEVGVKATRLRRRLSIEAEDVKSPSVQSTPTKKRGGRLAAKPQLELIDENATPKDKPTRTRKSTIQNAEPEEKVVTPSRRSTRIRSNTSILSETPGDTEDKGTPSRRNTRVKSNTSIVAEAVLHVDSPRAKRAARRLSQVGSDNEAPITPARSTRKAKKDSTPTVDKQAEVNPGNIETPTTDIIVELDESNDRDGKKSIKNENEELSPSTRRSPRLIEKLEKLPSPDNNKENEISINVEDTSDITNAIRKIIHKDSEKANISISTSELINHLSGKPQKQHTNLNKTTSALQQSQSKEKRHRTTSWTMATSHLANDNNFLSDTEAIRKSKRKVSNVSDSSDNLVKDNKKNTRKSKGKHDVMDVSLNRSTLSETIKKTQDSSITNGETVLEDATNANTSNELEKSPENLTRQAKNVDSASSPKDETNLTEKYFGEAPTGPIESLVYIEDSDSNTGIDTNNVIKKIDGGDQCVPVVERQSNDEISQEQKNNLSCEPMDIDETMPENVSLSVFSDGNISAANKTGAQKTLKNRNSLAADILNKSQKKSELKDDTEAVLKNSPLDKSKRNSLLVSNSDLNSSNRVDKVNDSLNKSKRKSSVSAGDNENTLNESAKKIDIKSVNNDYNILEVSNKSNRKSSINLADNDCSSIDKSNINLDAVKEDTVSKRRSNVAQSTSFADNTVDNCDKSNRKLSNRDSVDNSALVKKSRKSSIVSSVNIDGNDSKINDNDIKKSSDNTEEVSISSKSLREYEANDTLNDKSIEPSSKKDKSKRKSSISHTQSQIFDKSNSENKSTLIISQIKNTTENCTTKDMSELNELNESIEQFSKSKVGENKLKNHSLTYSTSTPLQQKPLKKLGIQINSLPSTPNIEMKNSSVRSTHQTSALSLKDGKSKSNEEEENSDEDPEEHSGEDKDKSGEDEEESIEEESSFENSKECSKDESGDMKLIDNEAEDAGDDYESGDSQDEDEREYEIENEIKEKGETLDSEDEDFSDDSEYEKGSFVVDSDDEDAELLSGSGDDLSMSADELSMSAKSKKKFNERKMKEQKKASREMFEARHKLNESKTKNKKNRQRLESSESESETSVGLPKKQHKRLRIDSSQDINTADNSGLNVKKNTSKRLSHSVREENESNEKEITICETLETEKKDPLSLQNIVKEEPKTPLKAFNVSSVPIMDDVENVDIGNVSIVKSNQTSDPLEVTMAPDEEDENDSEESISENEEITENYESVLKDLNEKSNKVKSTDLSLNLNKKDKKKVKEPVVDQLNLTQVKKSKKTKIAAQDKQPENIVKDKLRTSKIFETVNKSMNHNEEGSSDSIDLQLLFNEDSTDGVIRNKKEIIEEVIPLKRTEGKTNMLETSSHGKGDSSAAKLNVSKSKKKKKKSFSAVDDEGTESLQFFIDTTGTYSDKEESVNNTSINKSKKNKQKHNVSAPKVEVTEDDGSSNEAPLEISYRGKKSLDVSKQSLNISRADDTNVMNAAGSKTPTSAKKNKQGLNNSQSNYENAYESTNEAPLEISYRGKKSLDVSKQTLNISRAEDTNVMNAAGSKTPTSAKKNKQGLNSSQSNYENALTDKNLSVGSITNSSKKKTNKSVASIVEETAVNTVIAEEKSRKRKRKSSVTHLTEENNVKDNNTPSGSKVLSDSLVVTNQKKKRKISDNIANEDIPIKDTNVVSKIKTNEQKKDSEKPKKKNKNVPDQKPAENTDSNVVSKAKTKEQEKVLERAKTKNKSVPAQKPVENIDSNIFSKIKTKEQEKVPEKTKTKNQNAPEQIPVENNELIKKSKKRKERDDDVGDKVSKVVKQNYFDKVNVPRLPASIIKELDEKPKKAESKQKLISTTSFQVEVTRQKRNKPSNYLEQSVYLNDSIEKQTKKQLFKPPKVLPFVPTASTSDFGFTTKFSVNVTPKETQFVAQYSEIANFKNDYLQKNRIKKLGTLEKYKRHRNIKISKF